jgi:hypothetical protein
MTRKASPVSNRVAGLFERSDVQASKRSEVQAFEPQNPQAPKRRKKTLYLSPEADVLLTQLQLERLKATGDKPELSELVNEAILLLGQQNSESF